MTSASPRVRLTVALRLASPTPGVITTLPAYRLRGQVVTLSRDGTLNTTRPAGVDAC